MTLQELSAKYTSAELSNLPGDKEFRFKTFSPFFENLYDNKIVYYEKFVCIAQLEDIKITPESFSAIAIPLLEIEKHSFNPNPFYPTKPWKFSTIWDWICLSGNKFFVPYGGWTVWPEPEKVRRVEELVKKGDHERALELTISE